MTDSSDEDVDTNSENEFPSFFSVDNSENSINSTELDSGGDDSPSSIFLKLRPITKDFNPRPALTSETTDVDSFVARHPRRRTRRAPFDIINEDETPANHASVELNDLLDGLKRRKRRVRFDLDQVDEHFEILALESESSSLGSNATDPNIANNQEFRPRSLYRVPASTNLAASGVRAVRGRRSSPPEDINGFTGASVPLPDSDDDDEVIVIFDRRHPPPRNKKPRRKRSPATLPPLPDFDDDDDEVLFPEPTDSRFVLPGALREIEQRCRLSEAEIFARSELVIQVLMMSLSEPVKDADTRKDNYCSRIGPTREENKIHNPKKSEDCNYEEHK